MVNGKEDAMVGHPETNPEKGPEKSRLTRMREQGHPRRALMLMLLPHVFTTAGLFCGFYSIVQATSGEFDKAALGIVMAGLFDLFDGRVARMVHVESAFGEQFDSLTDVVAFGVAPAMLALSAGDLQGIGRVGWVCTFLYAACAALRLARFNVHPSAYANRFEGLPTTAAGGAVAATTWFALFLHEEFGAFTIPPSLVAAGTVLLALLMVSSIPYRSTKGIKLRPNYQTFVFFAVGFALIMTKPAVTLFLIAVGYVGSGPVEWLWRRKTGNVLQPTIAIPEEEPVELFPDEEKNHDAL